MTRRVLLQEPFHVESCAVKGSVVPEKSGGLNRSMQHWLAVYSPAFESPRSLAVVG
jgi:hypothetical protein